MQDTPALLTVLGQMMRRENRIKELVEKAGGRVVPGVHDAVRVEGLSDEQYLAIALQLSKEFP